MSGIDERMDDRKRSVGGIILVGENLSTGEKLSDVPRVSPQGPQEMAREQSRDTTVKNR